MSQRAKIQNIFAPRSELEFRHNIYVKRKCDMWHFSGYETVSIGRIAQVCLILYLQNDLIQIV